MGSAYANDLARLTEKAEAAEKAEPRAQEQDITARPRRGMPISAVARIIARFAEGEEATARFCALARPRLSCETARRFIDLQRRDEERHAALYRRYLATLSRRAAPSRALDAIYVRALGFDGAIEGPMLAFHVVLERDNLMLQRGATRMIGCPTFEALSKEIQHDEARHVAFGDLYLRRHLPLLSLGERLEIAVWLRTLWLDAADEILSNVLGPLASLGAWERRRRRSLGWKTRLAALGAAGLFTSNERPLFERAS